MWCLLWTAPCLDLDNVHGCAHRRGISFSSCIVGCHGFLTPVFATQKVQFIFWVPHSVETCLQLRCWPHELLFVDGSLLLHWCGREDKSLHDMQATSLLDICSSLTWKQFQLQSYVHLVFIDSALVFSSLFASGSDLENYNATATLKSRILCKSLIMVQYRIYNLSTTGIIVN